MFWATKHYDDFFLGCHRISKFVFRVVVLTGHSSPLEVWLLPFAPAIYLYINVIYATYLCYEYIVTVNKMNFELFVILV
jgi:hypothetical protein